MKRPVSISALRGKRERKEVTTRQPIKPVKIVSAQPFDWSLGGGENQKKMNDNTDTNAVTALNNSHLIGLVGSSVSGKTANTDNPSPIARVPRRIFRMR